MLSMIDRVRNNFTLHKKAIDIAIQKKINENIAHTCNVKLGTKKTTIINAFIFIFVFIAMLTWEQWCSYPRSCRKKKG
jgi:hypothetical protein